MTVEELTKYILAAHTSRAKVKALRAKGERASEGEAPGYLPALIGFVYNEYLEIYLQTLPGDEQAAEDYMGDTPERLILESLFTLFLNHFDEGEVRELFAEFGPKPPRIEAQQREIFLLHRYLHEGDLHKGLPNKSRFAQAVADYNKSVPREKRLGSRATSQANILRDLERALVTHREEVTQALGAARMLARDGLKLRVPAPEMPIEKTIPLRHFRRKMSRRK
jgi:hypothetical protein